MLIFTILYRTRQTPVVMCDVHFFDSAFRLTIRYLAFKQAMKEKRRGLRLSRITPPGFSKPRVSCFLGGVVVAPLTPSHSACFASAVIILGFQASRLMKTRYDAAATTNENRRHWHRLRSHPGPEAFIQVPSGQKRACRAPFWKRDITNTNQSNAKNSSA